MSVCDTAASLQLGLSCGGVGKSDCSEFSEKKAAETLDGNGFPQESSVMETGAL